MERPSRTPLEKRTAIERLKEGRDELKVVRKAIVGAHATLRMLLHAAQLAERREALASLRAGARIARDAESATIGARFAECRRHLAMIVDANARAAAEQQLAMEERAEHMQLALRQQAIGRDQRRATLQPLYARQRQERRSLALRQRHERAVLGVMLQQMRPRPLTGGTSSDTRRLTPARKPVPAGGRGRS